MIVSFSSCQIFDPADSIPSYIRINEAAVVIDTPSLGTGSHRITDAWVYIDNNLIGAFELPAIIPVIASGNHSLSVRPGIHASGFTDLRVRYPFYEPYTQNFAFYPDSIYNINFEVHYSGSAEFVWTEDFEGSGIKLASASGSGASLVVTNDPSLVFEGTKSGKIAVSSSGNSFECISTGGSSPFPLEGSSVYLELNYRSTMMMTVGVYAYSSSVTVQDGVLNLYPSEGWNKIYIDLTGRVKNYPGASGFNVYFSGQLPDGASEAEIYLDNIKLLN